MEKKIAVLAGDGIGPEVIRQAIKAVEAVGAVFQRKFQFEYALFGAEAIDKTGVPLPDKTLEVCRSADAILLGAVGDPRYDMDSRAAQRPEQGLLQLRKTLGLYANIRPVTAYEATLHLTPVKAAIAKKTDLVIFRELTGGIYFGEKREGGEQGEYASDLCTYHRFEIERIAHAAFRMAMSRQHRLTLVDKANVLASSRLWRQVVQDISSGYPQVFVDYMYVDNAAMQLMLQPRQFDVILTENMFGDILSDEASVLAGSLGMSPSASIGDEYALFEPVHGSYPQAAGKDIANPVAAILSAAMMLDHLDMPAEADTVRKAVGWCMDNRFVTRDLDPVNFYHTGEIGDLVSAYIYEQASIRLRKQAMDLSKSCII